MDKETRSRALTHDCVFHQRTSARTRGAVGCADKSKCSKCGWNPEVKKARLEKIREGYTHE